MFQNFFTFNSNQRIALFGVFLGFIILFLPVIVFFLYYGAPHGDLVRIGKLPTKYFINNTAKEKIKILPNNVENSEMVVLGDSFSVYNIWQTLYTKETGQKISSYHYKNDACIEGWLNDVLKQKQPPKAIVLETVERYFFSRYAAYIDDCDKSIKINPNKVELSEYPIQANAANIFPLDINYFFSMFAHSQKILWKMPPYDFGIVKVAQLSRSNLFSHQYSNYLLYYSEDIDEKIKYANQDNLKKAIAKLQYFRKMANDKGVKLYILVVPDKLSVYMPWIDATQAPTLPNIDLYKTLQAEFGGYANLLLLYQQLANQHADIYLPEDTHFSLLGYRFLAQHLIEQR